VQSIGYARAMHDDAVTRCPAAQRPAALRLLYAAADAAPQGELALAVRAADAGGEAHWDGLLVVGGDRPQAAIWVQPMAGSTALVWPPPATDAAAPSLFRAAAAFADERQLHVAQLIVADEDGFEPEKLSQWGFSCLAELIYMYANVSERTILAMNSPQSLQFNPAPNDPARLASVIERTYVGTRDCPALDGVRSMEDVIAGYQAQGVYLPNEWRLVADGGHDVGVLVMAGHPAFGNWELVYMGLTPEARGRRLGEAISRFALASAAAGGAERLVLAVDAANEPALAVYRRTGFREWDRRRVYVHLAPPRASSTTG
jgi:ribosomal protein S18 acetylase RimI-like enzyme